jgi:hypothetical protein
MHAILSFIIILYFNSPAFTVAILKLPIIIAISTSFIPFVTLVTLVIFVIAAVLIN